MACFVIFITMFKELRLLPIFGPQLRTSIETVIDSKVIFFTILLFYLVFVLSFISYIGKGLSKV